MADNKLKQSHEPESFVKKPFNKKKWREEKYSNKNKVKRWQEKRKTILQRQLKKQLEKEGVVSNLPGAKVAQISRPSRLKDAQLEFERQREIKKQEAEEARLIKEEKMKKIAEYRAKKAERFRKLSQKTRKGQPLMKGRLEILQEKIQQMISSNKI